MKRTSGGKGVAVAPPDDSRLRLQVKRSNAVGVFCKAKLCITAPLLIDKHQSEEKSGLRKIEVRCAQGVLKNDKPNSSGVGWAAMRQSGILASSQGKWVTGKFWPWMKKQLQLKRCETKKCWKCKNFYDRKSCDVMKGYQSKFDKIRSNMQAQAAGKKRDDNREQQRRAESAVAQLRKWKAELEDKLEEVKEQLQDAVMAAEAAKTTKGKKKTMKGKRKETLRIGGQSAKRQRLG